MKNKVFMIGMLLIGLMNSCGHKPSKVELLRQERARKDSIEWIQAQQTIRYSDSLLQVLQPQVDPLLKKFRYEKNEKVEDHGRYVHSLLQTDRNTARCFLQAYVSDDRKTTLQSFYFGTKPIQHNHIKLSVGDLYIDKEGSCHSFEAEGIHEILSLQQEDAIELLQFISSNSQERILVTLSGKSKATYYLQDNEKQALSETYQLAVIMNDIAQLEQAIRIASLQVQKQEKRKERNKNN